MNKRKKNTRIPCFCPFFNSHFLNESIDAIKILQWAKFQLRNGIAKKVKSNRNEKKKKKLCKWQNAFNIMIKVDACNIF